MELAILEILMYLEDIKYELRFKNIVSIITHPERYREIKENPNKLIKFIELGALCQLNLGSIVGHYGEEIKKTARILVEHNMIRFVGTDAHSKTRRPPKCGEAIEELKDIISEEKIDKLIWTNPMNIIENKEIEISDPIRYEPKKGIGKLIKLMFGR